VADERRVQEAGFRFDDRLSCRLADADLVHGIGIATTGPVGVMPEQFGRSEGFVGVGADDDVEKGGNAHHGTTLISWRT